MHTFVHPCTARIYVADTKATAVSVGRRINGSRNSIYRVIISAPATLWRRPAHRDRNSLVPDVDGRTDRRTSYHRNRGSVGPLWAVRVDLFLFVGGKINHMVPNVRRRSKKPFKPVVFPPKNIFERFQNVTSRRKNSLRKVSYNAFCR